MQGERAAPSPFPRPSPLPSPLPLSRSTPFPLYSLPTPFPLYSHPSPLSTRSTPDPPHISKSPCDRSLHPNHPAPFTSLQPGAVEAGLVRALPDRKNSPNNEGAVPRRDGQRADIGDGGDAATRRQKRHQAQTQTQTQTHRRRSSAEDISRRRCGEVAVSCCSRSSSRSLKALGACTDEVLLGQPAERIVSVHKRTRCNGCVKYCEVRTARCVYISNKA